MVELKPRFDILRDRTGRVTRGHVVAGVLALAVLVLVAFTARDVFFPPTPSFAGATTATVQRTTVSASVTASGTVQPVTQRSVGFRVSGILSEVDVNVGDKVNAGQVLAKIDPTTYQNSVDQAQLSVDGAQRQITQDQQASTDTSGQVALKNQQAATQLSQDQNQYNLDGCLNTPQPAKCTADQNLIDKDKLNIQLTQASGQQSMHQAAATIAKDQDQLTTAQAQLQTAQQNLGYVTLTSPIAGTVVTVNGGVGDPAGGSGGGSSSSSPGSSSGASGSSGSGSSGSSGSGSSGSSGASGASSGSGSSSSSSSSSSGTGSSAGGSFITISDTSSLQVVAPAAEADAVRITTNQKAQVTFDAIPGLTLPGHVISISPAATQISNVTNYYVTLALDQGDPRIRQGMTANAAVVVNSIGNVLALPSSALRHAAGQTYVMVLGAKGVQQRIDVQTGLVGDTLTQVSGTGLNQGQQVLLPQVRTGGSTTTGGAPTRGLGGGGGGGVFGGGGRGGGG